MALSLEQLSRKIGDQRRTVTELNSKLQEGVKAFDVKDTEYSELNELLNGLAEGSEPTAEQTAKATSLRDEMKSLRLSNMKLADDVRAAKEDLTDMESDFSMRKASNELEDYLGSSAGRIGSDGASLNDASGLNSKVRVLAPTNEQMDHHLGVYLQCQILSQLSHRPAADIAANHFKNDFVSSASMHADEHGIGGSWIAGVFSTRFIELLRAKSIVRMMGCDMVPLDDGSLMIPKETSGPSGQYLGERESADNETIGTGDVRLVAKELVCQVTSSEKLLRSPSANAAQRILTSVLRGAGLTEDLYFLRGAPSGAGPTGMRYLAHADNVLAVNATVNLANITNDLGKAELALLNANVSFENTHWVMAPRTMVYLMDLRDGNGNLAWPSLQGPNPTLRNKPVHTTTQIPINLGGGGNESEILLAEANHLIIGDAPRVGFDSSNVAAYNDGGTVKAAFSERKVVSRLVMENDFNTKYDKAIAVLTEVDWGA